MGRGKSKAKQTKVARELKYGSGNSDLSALEEELRTEHNEQSAVEVSLVPKSYHKEEHLHDGTLF